MHSLLEYNCIYAHVILHLTIDTKVTHWIVRHHALCYLGISHVKLQRPYRRHTDWRNPPFKRHLAKYRFFISIQWQQSVCIYIHNIWQWTFFLFFSCRFQISKVVQLWGIVIISTTYKYEHACVRVLAWLRRDTCMTAYKYEHENKC